MNVHKAQMVFLGGFVAALSGCIGVESDDEARDDPELMGDSDNLANSTGTAEVDWSNPAVGVMTSEGDENGNCTAGMQHLGGACTGTLIGTRTVLTAAHCKFPRFKACVSGMNSPILRSGTPVSHADFDKNLPSDTRLNHDIAILRLNDEIAVKSVTPRNFNTRVPTEGAVVDLWGMGGHVVGAGLGVKRRGSNKIWRLAQWQYFIDKSKGVSICGGDSGGPSFLRSGGAQVGVNVASSRNCNDKTGISVATRVDAHQEWLMVQSKFNAWPAAPFGTQASKKLVRANTDNCSYVERAGKGQSVKYGPCPSGNGSRWDLVLSTSGTHESLFVLRNRLDNKCLQKRADDTFETADCFHASTGQPVSIFRKSNGKHMMISRDSDLCISGASHTNKLLRSRSCDLNDAVLEFDFIDFK